MKSTLETIALALTLGVVIVATTENATVDTEITTVLCSEPGGGGVLPPPPQN